MTPVGTATGQADRVLGGWLGRIAGNMLGKPVEQGDYWTRDRIDRYLRRAARPAAHRLSARARCGQRERRLRTAARVA